MSTELDIYRGAPLEERQQYALTLARAVDILPKPLRKVNPQDPDAARQETAARAFLIMETGDMLGLHPMAALAGVNVIEGKPALSSGLMSAVIRSAGHKLHVTETGTIEGGDYKATATLIREDDPEHPFSSTWTPHRAQRAGLCKYEEGTGGIWKVTARSQSGNPLPWEAYTESLCKSRAISEVSRDGGQDALLGIRYTPEELESGAAEFGGELVQAEEEPAKAPRKTPARGRQGTKRKAAPVDMPPPADSDEADRDAVRPEEEIVDAEVVEEAPTPELDDAEREEAERRAAEAAAAEARYHEEDASSEPQAEALAEPPAEVTDDGVARLRAQQAAEVERQQARLAESKPEPQQEHTARPYVDTIDGKTYATGAESKPEPQQEHTARPYVDTIDGKTYATEAELLEAQKARVKAKQAARAAEAEQAVASGEPSAFDLALTEEPDNYQRQIDAATTLDECKDVWQRATDAKAMDSALRLAVIRQKAILEQASA